MASALPVTVEISHVVAVKILVPTLEHLIVRAAELVEATGDEPPYATWVRITGYGLLAAVREELSATRWGERPLRLALGPDALGLLAAALGSLRRSAAGTDNALLEEARLRLWLTVPLETELTWWLPREQATGELAPLLRTLGLRAQGNDRQRLGRIERSLATAQRSGSDDALRLRSRLDDLCWLAEQARQGPTAPRLQVLLEQLVDPLLSARLWATAAGASQSEPAGVSHSATHRRTETAPSQTVPPSIPGQPAPVLQRFVAWVIDSVAFLAAFGLGTAVAPLFFTGSAQGIILLDATLYDTIVGLLALAGPLALVYGFWIYPVGRWGATIGMRAVSIRAVDETGRPPGQAKALGRTIVAVLLWWLLLLPWWPALSRADRRGLHDLAANVWVVTDGTQPRN
ncbi:RDD family protein [Thermomicrobium sp. 4228-Ro]|uniref:RDD family protein n=1 Tax=Thermomicrobium sp. 4228-Ro TaxID=2993937 RepID=UPI00224948F9|nr:RDD family protein [Thermomicrobium sp. 4228-Ro]MCX2727200.1 RDD family protein [Thermomicrobium sp. 4228-Ro]